MLVFHSSLNTAPWGTPAASWRYSGSACGPVRGGRRGGRHGTLVRMMVNSFEGFRTLKKARRHAARAVPVAPYAFEACLPDPETLDMRSKIYQGNHSWLPACGPVPGGRRGGRQYPSVGINLKC